MCNGPDQFGICNWGSVVWRPVAAGTACSCDENGDVCTIGWPAGYPEAPSSAAETFSTLPVFSTTTPTSATPGFSTLMTYGTGALGPLATSPAPFTTATRATNGTYMLARHSPRSTTLSAVSASPGCTKTVLARIGRLSSATCTQYATTLTKWKPASCSGCVVTTLGGHGPVWLLRRLGCVAAANRCIDGEVWDENDSAGNYRDLSRLLDSRDKQKGVEMMPQAFGFLG